MPILSVITNPREIEKFFDAFEEAVCRGQKVNAKMSWLGGDTTVDVNWQPSLGLWSYFDWEWRTGNDNNGNPKKPSAGGVFGVTNPLTAVTSNLTVEINYDHDTPRKMVAGRYLKDKNGRYYLGHSGRVGGGKKGISKQNFLAFYPTRNLQPIDWGEDDYENVIVLGALDDPNLPVQVAAFVHQVARFKDLVDEANVIGAPLPTREAQSDEQGGGRFRPEFQGVKKYKRKQGRIEAECNHGLVITRLAEEVERLGYTVANDRARDLFIPSACNHARVLFEAKTDLATTSIYTAIGQLMFHGARQEEPPKRVFVVPGAPKESTRTALARLNMRCSSSS